MDQDSKKSPFEALQPEHRPLASGEPVPVYVSYAWDDPTIAWVDELERTLPPGLRLLRDRNEVRPGGWISTFMQDIGRAEYVVVVLSTKYLQSQYCMRELLYMRDRSLGDRAELMGRIVPVVMEDLKISDGEHRLTYVEYWLEKHARLEAKITKVGFTGAGGASRDELLAMKDFVHRTDELLSWGSDVLMPRVRKGDTRSTIQAVIEVLLQRVTLTGGVDLKHPSEQHISARSPSTRQAKLRDVPVKLTIDLVRTATDRGQQPKILVRITDPDGNYRAQWAVTLKSPGGASYSATAIWPGAGKVFRARFAISEPRTGKWSGIAIRNGTELHPFETTLAYPDNA